MVGDSEKLNSSPLPKSHGITKPISLAGPTEADHLRNAELEKFLMDSGLYESKEEAEKREEVLNRIREIVKGWVKQLTRQRGYTDQMVEDANALIFTFGSYRLGVSMRAFPVVSEGVKRERGMQKLGIVHGPGADIDTLCVGPSYVNRDEDFFVILHNILAEIEEVSELQPVPDAHVPVMKFKFQGVSIDLLYASVSMLDFVGRLRILRGIPAKSEPGEMEREQDTNPRWKWLTGVHNVKTNATSRLSLKQAVRNSAGENPARLRSLATDMPTQREPAGTETADQPSPYFSRGETQPLGTRSEKLT
ncbi:hypothetical protein Cgig2_027927 [Carnegiea gigantea]|uniref:Poly(A) polymerase nucleotidyltransferase domain-containing protein n=1 Tax=Carnegiea gigantea TaxID=171969 RepID=A0A9Q1QLD2_9CARY|nr:hypothetical protein Cgig2_027927 [Carnegiea gigantea]